MNKHLLLIPVAVALPATAVHATTYLTIEQAQAAMFPGEAMTPAFRTLTDAQLAAIRKAAGVSPLGRSVKAWKAAGGGWLIADEVVGKHEFIQFAVAIDAAGALKSVEIMDYRESYGGQVRDPRWRAQFVGKRAGQPLQLGHEIKNISGATLSSKHVTDGVRRLLDTYAIVFANG